MTTERRGSPKSDGHRHGESAADIFRWEEGGNVNQKVVSSAIIAEALAISFVKNIKEIPQDDANTKPNN